MQVTTITFFRFSGFFSRVWAFFQMQLAKRPLRSIPDIGFHKLMGTGAGEGFDLAPDFSTYAILATWPSIEVAQDRLRDENLFERYRRRSSEQWTVYLAAHKARGSWDTAKPFDVVTADVLPVKDADEAVAVLTRASLARRHLWTFWRSVPPISQITRSWPGLHFKLGMGELPVVQLMTFSLWRATSRMRNFAYDTGPHRTAMQMARSEGWFKEELFARFRVLRSEGSWQGQDPIETLAASTPETHA